MKKLLIIVLFAVTGSYLIHSQPVREHGQLGISGNQLVDRQGDPVVLRGMSYGWHNWWPRFYNKGTVQWLKSDWNCTILRAAMGIEPEKGYLDRPGWSVRLIKRVVEAAIKEDIYVIIDWHSHSIQLNEARAFFAEMAETYGNYPHIIYEIFNEPVDQTWEEVKSYSAEIISAIRMHDPDNIILVGSPHWDQDIHLVAANPLTGFDNIMYTVHFYAATHKQWLRDKCNDALDKGIPLFVSESAGMEASGNGLIDYDEWHSWIAWMEQNKIS
jgi:endoglucanase